MTRPPEQRLLTEANADGVVAAHAANPATALGAALNATYVGAVDEAGAPIPGHAGRIIFNADGEPLNIVLEEI